MFSQMKAKFELFFLKQSKKINGCVFYLLTSIFFGMPFIHSLT
jgi:hypothetical protein